jgi:hypothetical protein
LENLDAAILSLERLQQEGRRRGRPPKALLQSKLTGARKADAGTEDSVEKEG